MLAATQRDAAANIGFVTHGRDVTLITAYFGGAIALHLRNNDPAINFVRALAVCGLLWLPVYLRNPGLIALLPFKRSPSMR
jgi:hypothetical protein